MEMRCPVNLCCHPEIIFRLGLNKLAGLFPATYLPLQARKNTHANVAPSSDKMRFCLIDKEKRKRLALSKFNPSTSPAFLKSWR